MRAYQPLSLESSCNLIFLTSHVSVKSGDTPGAQLLMPLSKRQGQRYMLRTQKT